MNRNSVAYDQYRSDFEELERQSLPSRSRWLSDTRRAGFAEFERLRFPTATRGNERWKYTNVAPIAKGTFGYHFGLETHGTTVGSLDRLVPWQEDWIRLVFVDGLYVEALSNLSTISDQIHVSNLPDAMVTRGGIVEGHLGSLVSAESDGFSAVNTAFLRDGAFVQLSEGVETDRVIHLVFLATGDDYPVVSHPRTLVLAEPNSKLTLVESYVGLTEAAYFTNAVTEIVVEDGAQVEHYRYMREGQNAFHIGTTRVALGSDSIFDSVSFARGSDLARNDLGVLLNKAGSTCRLSGLYQTSGNQHIDNHIDIDHASPHSSSDQYFKGILDGHSRGVFTGRVLVRPDAQKTVARQADKNLLLSDGARIHTKPSLEIFADDVQCFHGATAGAVEDDAMFYMRSRGLDEETARSLIVYGFASEILDRVQLDPFRSHIDALLLEGRYR